MKIRARLQKNAGTKNRSSNRCPKRRLTDSRTAWTPKRRRPRPPSPSPALSPGGLCEAEKRDSKISQNEAKRSFGINKTVRKTGQNEAKRSYETGSRSAVRPSALSHASSETYAEKTARPGRNAGVRRLARRPSRGEWGGRGAKADNLGYGCGLGTQAPRDAWANKGRKQVPPPVSICFTEPSRTTTNKLLSLEHNFDRKGQNSSDANPNL
jgi:hypothetical protein